MYAVIAHNICSRPLLKIIIQRRKSPSVLQEGFGPFRNHCLHARFIALKWISYLFHKLGGPWEPGHNRAHMSVLVSFPDCSSFSI